MEKETFYQKLQKLKPTVKSYFDAKKIADMPEVMYVLEKCGANKPNLNTDMLKPEEVKSLKDTKKIFTVILGLATVWGVVCAIIGIANLSGMDIVLGAGICVGSFFLYRYLNSKLGEKMCAVQEQQAKVDEYNEQVEKVKAERRAIIDGIDAKAADMKAKFEELGLSSVFSHAQSYEGFSSMLSYAKKHPDQTTPSSYLKEVTESKKAYYHKKHMESIESELAIDDRNYNDMSSARELENMLKHDREERFRHDLEMQRREENARRDAEMKAARRAWDEKKKQEAQDRIDNRKKSWEEINERARLRKELRHQCNTCSLASKCYMSGSFPCPTYRPR